MKSTSSHRGARCKLSPSLRAGLPILFVSALILLGSAPVSFGANPPTARSTTNIPFGATGYCAGAGFGAGTWGLYAVKGGAIVLSGDGYLNFCATTAVVFGIASPPLGSSDYAGLGGTSTTTLGTVLIVLNGKSAPGFWLCEGATKAGCKTQSKFYAIPSAFCSKMKSGFCDPKGGAIDPKLNVYYTDPTSGVVVKCTHSSSYKTCSVKETLPGQPFGIYRNPKTGDLWVTDYSCNGDVWKNGVLQVQYGDRLEGITISSANPQKSPHVYFATSGVCVYGFGHIFDFTDKDIVTPMGQPFSNAQDIFDISTALQFTTGSSGNIWIAQDS